MRPPVRHIVRATEIAFGLPKGAICSSSREKQILIARYLACWIARRRYGYSYPVIGQGVNRHHTTVIGSVSLVDHAMKSGRIRADTIELIDERLRGRER